ncbi:MAG: glycosyltransferase [Candidatus Hydrogenedentes bacterium]|jgi:glycosyltransferase involved in cell wall biosynthesis|nr:glycosyltransferase [Candidatus Hydrogenedentota bacterium]
MATFSISAILVLEDKEEALPVLLTCFEKQTLPAALFEVVLVFYGKGDATNHDSVQRYISGMPMHIQSHFVSTQNAIVAKNIGATQATGDILFFLDQDLLASPKLLAAHRDLHENTDRPAVIMGTVERNQNLSRGSLTRWFMREDLALMDAGRADHAFYWSGRHCSFRRSSLLEAGGFNESFVSDRAADIQLAQEFLKHKHKMLAMQEHAAYIWHLVNFEKERRRYWREGYDLAKLSQERKNPAILYHFRLAPSSFRYHMSNLFAPFYIKSCTVPKLDTRIHGQSLQHIFHLARCSGARAALAGHPPHYQGMEEINVQSSVKNRKSLSAVSKFLDP